MRHQSGPQRIGNNITGNIPDDLLFTQRMVVKRFLPQGTLTHQMAINPVRGARFEAFYQRRQRFSLP
jgi:hypothetical protein